MHLAWFTSFGLFLSCRISFQEAVYKDAAHYWPLDSITGIKDTVTHRQASILGLDEVKLKGKGNGFMELFPGKSIVNLGQFTDSCLVNSNDCKSGITITLWIKIVQTRAKGELFDLFRIRKDGFTDLIKIGLNYVQNPELTFSAHHGGRYYFQRIALQLGIWIHSTIVLTNSGEPRLFLNGNEKTEFQPAPFIPGKLMTMKRSVSVIVGQLSDIIEGILVTGYGPAVQYDEIAIFYKELNKEAMEDIFIKNFGQIKLHHNCASNESSIQIKWQPPFDTYDQLFRYVITVKSSKYMKVFTAHRNSTSARLSGLSANKVYEMAIVGETISGFLVNGTTKVTCSTNITKHSFKQKGGLIVMGIDVDKIRVLWIITKDVTQLPIGYGVSYHTNGIPANYKVIFGGESLNYTIMDLKPDTTYTVSVTVFTRESGKYKEEIGYAKTKRIIYLPTSPIRNLSISEIDWNRAKLEWMAPLNYTEPTVVYSIRCNSKDYERFYETNKTNLELKDLTEDTYHEVEVNVGAKEIGYYNETITIKLNTLVRFPAPSGVKVTNVKSNMAEISWYPIVRSEKIIYKIEVHSELNETQIYSMKTKYPHLTLKNLQQEMGYFFKLRSGNGTYFGAEVSSNGFFVTPDRNECLDGTHSCKSVEKCMNKRGSYECHCKKEYFRNGDSCEKMKKDEPKCAHEVSRKIEWSETQNGQTANTKCPKGTSGIARRFCTKVNSSYAEWSSPDLSDCVSNWINDFSYQLRRKERNSSYLMKALNKEYKKQIDVVGGDIKNVVTMMADIVDMMLSSKANDKELKDTAENLVTLTDNLLSTDALITWNDLPKEKQVGSAGNILKNVESMAHLYSSSAEIDEILIETNSTVMEVRRLLDSSDLQFESMGTKSSISIPYSIARSHSNDAVYFGSFKNIDSFLGTSLDSESDTNDVGYHDKRLSNIVAATLFPKRSALFQQPVIITHRIPQTNQSEIPHCVFWNFTSSNKKGSWSTNGCQLHSNNRTHVTCHCFHLTNFAVLMSVTEAPLKMKKTHEVAMALITQICIGISLAALLISFVTFCSIRAIKSERNSTHKNLVAALFLAQLLFLFGIDKTFNILICKCIAISLHYLFLVAFTLMGMEGFVLYLMLIKVYKRNTGFGHGKLLFACWAFPVIIVGVTAAVDMEAYTNQKYCWISPLRGFIWSFVGPVISVLVFNTVIIILAVQVMRKKSKKRDMITEEIWYWIKCLSMLVTILGLGWTIGLLYINQDTVFMAYAFSVLNASQGLAIFVFFCILDQRIQEFYCKILCCSRRGQYHPNISRSSTGTKSTFPSKQSQEVNENSCLKNAVLIKPLRLSQVSTEDQEMTMEFSEDEVDEV